MAQAGIVIATTRSRLPEIGIENCGLRGFAQSNRCVVHVAVEIRNPQFGTVNWHAECITDVIRGRTHGSTPASTTYPL